MNYKIVVKNKQHDFSIGESEEGYVYLICKDAGINQLFDKEDAMDIILDLEDLITEEHKAINQ